MALHWRLVGERLRHAKAKMQARQQAALTAVLARYHKVHSANCTTSQSTALQDQGRWPTDRATHVMWHDTVKYKGGNCALAHGRPRRIQS